MVRTIRIHHNALTKFGHVETANTSDSDNNNKKTITEKTAVRRIVIDRNNLVSGEGNLISFP